MIRFTIVLIIQLMFATITVAQTSTIDSLLQAVYRAGNDRDKLTAILSLCDEYQSVNRDTLDHYAYKARAMAIKTGDKKAMALAEIAVANDYFRWGWVDSAVVVIDPVIKGNKVGVPAERATYFKAARQQALYYGSRSKYTEALTNLYSIVNEAEKVKDTMVISTNMNTIGSIAIAREAPTEALQWLRRALSYLDELPRYNMVRASVYVNLAQAHLLNNQQDSAIFYGENGIQLLRRGQNLNTLAMALQRQSNIYLKAGHYDKAESALQAMIGVREKMGDGAVWTDDHISLINFYITTKQIDKAIAYCEEKLQRGDLHAAVNGTTKNFTNTLSLRIGYYDLLAKCYKIKGDTKAYEQTLEQIILAKDSLSDAEAELAIAEIQTKYEVQKKENTIIQQQLTIAQKNNILLLGLSTGAMVIVISFMVFRDYRKKQRLKMEKLIEHEKHLSIKAIADAEENERKRIAADLHDNLGAYAASIASNLDIIQVNGISEENRTALAELNNNSQTMVSQLSDTIWALNKDSLTLTAISDRIKVFLNRIRKSHQGIEMDVIEHIEQDISIPPTQAFHLFQVIQEAVTNAVKHSAARQIRIEVEGNSSWKISVADNGRGMSQEISTLQGGGNGLKNMQARASVAGWHISWEAAAPSGIKVIIEPMHN
jgi:signal transduction histidine kinase